MVLKFQRPRYYIRLKFDVLRPCQYHDSQSYINQGFAIRNTKQLRGVETISFLLNAVVPAKLEYASAESWYESHKANIEIIIRKYAKHIWY